MASGLAFGLLAQDRESGLQVGGLDVGDQAHLEPAAESVLEGRDGIRRTVGGQHELALALVQRVERVEELLLGLLAPFQELDVVDQQHIDVAVAPFELGAGVRADRVDELVQERLARHVGDPVVGVVLPDVVSDRLQEMGLAQSGVAVDEQRVVGPTGRLGHRQRRGVGESVRRPDDEGVEGELRLVQPITWWAGPQPGVGRLAMGTARVGHPEQGVERISGGRVLVGLGSNLDGDLDLRPADVADHALHERQVAGLEPVLHHHAGDGQHERVEIEPHRLDILERRAPDGVGDMRLQELSAGLPQLLSVSPHPFLHLFVPGVHKSVHNCGKRCRPDWRRLVRDAAFAWAGSPARPPRGRERGVTRRQEGDRSISGRAVRRETRRLHLVPTGQSIGRGCPSSDAGSTVSGGVVGAAARCRRPWSHSADRFRLPRPGDRHRGRVGACPRRPRGRGGNQ